MLKRLSGVIAVIFAILSLPVISCADANGTVVAVVNGATLYEPELNQEINAIMPLNQTFHGGLSEEKMKKIRTDAMKNLVDFELQAQDAQRKGITITPQVLDEEITKLTSNYKTQESLVAAYQGAGFTEKTFRRIFERRLLAEKIIPVEVDAKITVTPERVSKYYSENAAKYSKPEEFHARHILLKFDPSASLEERAKVRAKAEELLKRIKKGEDFEDIAAKESDDPSRIKGGDLGYFHAGQTVEEFEAALLKLKNGETSNVVETIYGYHIIQLIEKRPPRQTIDEIKGKITKDMVDAEKKQLLDGWMDGLYKKAVISYPGVK